jgi:predicted amidohydrolase
MPISGEIHARLRENAINLVRGNLQPVQDAAAKHGVTFVLGINELDSEFSGTTLFNSVVVIGPDSTLLNLNRHRKLTPTNPERRMAEGDVPLPLQCSPVTRTQASQPRVMQSPSGRNRASGKDRTPLLLRCFASQYS